MVSFCWHHRDDQSPCGITAGLKGTAMIITVHRVSVQFDADTLSFGTKEQRAQEAIALINTTLGREPFGLCAQIIAHPDEVEVVVEP
jgi:hypothetical protein